MLSPEPPLVLVLWLALVVAAGAEPGDDPTLVDELRPGLDSLSRVAAAGMGWSVASAAVLASGILSYLRAATLDPTLTIAIFTVGDASRSTVWLPIGRMIK